MTGEEGEFTHNSDGSLETLASSSRTQKVAFFLFSFYSES